MFFTYILHGTPVYSILTYRCLLKRSNPCFVIAREYFTVSRGTPGDGLGNPWLPRNPDWESLVYVVLQVIFIVIRIEC